jgi:hypothetical protein
MGAMTPPVRLLNRRVGRQVLSIKLEARAGH